MMVARAVLHQLLDSGCGSSWISLFKWWCWRFMILKVGRMLVLLRWSETLRLTLGCSTVLEDTQSDSIDLRKHSATSMELPGEDKRHRVDPLDASQMFMPYNPTGALYGPPPNSVPFQQYPAWPHGATPATCNCVPPFWCTWCRPPPYSYSYVSQ